MFWLMFMLILVYVVSVIIVLYIWIETNIHFDLFDCLDGDKDKLWLALFFAPFTLMFLPCYAIYKPFKKKKEEEKEHKRYRTQYKKCLVKNHKCSLYVARIQLQRIEKYIII